MNNESEMKWNVSVRNILYSLAYSCVLEQRFKYLFNMEKEQKLFFFIRQKSRVKQKSVAFRPKKKFQITSSHNYVNYGFRKF